MFLLIQIFVFLIFGSVFNKDIKSTYSFTLSTGIKKLLYFIFGFLVSKNKLNSCISILNFIVSSSKSMFFDSETLFVIELLNLLYYL